MGQPINHLTQIPANPLPTILSLSYFALVPSPPLPFLLSPLPFPLLSSHPLYLPTYTRRENTHAHKKHSPCHSLPPSLPPSTIPKPQKT